MTKKVTRARTRRAVTDYTDTTNYNHEKDTLVYALGGLGEVGKNMYCFEHDDEIIIVAHQRLINVLTCSNLKYCEVFDLNY